jgi:hypothetical protein
MQGPEIVCGNRSLSHIQLSAVIFVKFNVPKMVGNDDFVIPASKSPCVTLWPLYPVLYFRFSSTVLATSPCMNTFREMPCPGSTGASWTRYRS